MCGWCEVSTLNPIPFFGGHLTAHPKVGELYLWSMLHQMKLCRPSLFEKTPQLVQFYGRLEKDPKVQKVAWRWRWP